MSSMQISSSPVTLSIDFSKSPTIFNEDSYTTPEKILEIVFAFLKEVDKKAKENKGVDNRKLPHSPETKEGLSRITELLFKHKGALKDSPTLVGEILTADCLHLKVDQRIELIQAASGITTIDMSKTEITYEQLETLLSKNPQTKRLDLRKCTDLTWPTDNITSGSGTMQDSSKGKKSEEKSDIPTPLSYLKELEEVNLGEMPELTDAALGSIQSGVVKAAKFRKCTKLTPKGLADFISKEPMLVKLSVRGTATDVSVMASIAALKWLKDLDLHRCDKLDGNKALESLSDSSQIVILSMRDNKTLLDEAVIGFAKTHPHLEELILAGCKLLTDASLNALQKCQKLKKLDIRDNKNFSVEAIIAFVTASKGLKLLTLGEEDFTLEFAKELEKLNPNLKVKLERNSKSNSPSS